MGKWIASFIVGMGKQRQEIMADFGRELADFGFFLLFLSIFELNKGDKQILRQNLENFLILIDEIEEYKNMDAVNYKSGGGQNVK